MDIKINLLPPEISLQWEKQNRQRKILTLGGIVLSILLVSYGLVYTASLHARSEAARLQIERQILEREAEGYRQYTRLQSHLAVIEGIVQKAAGTNPDWPRLLTAIGRNMPYDVWLTDLSINFLPEDNTGQAVIRGQALGYAHISGWLKEINQMPGLSDVRCQFLAGQSRNDPLVQFEIKAVVLPAPDIHPEKENRVKG